MNDDALEILVEIKELVNGLQNHSTAYIIDAVNSYVINKSLEFVKSQGDCCG